MKRLAFALAAAVLVAAAVELLSFAVFGAFRDRFTFFALDAYLTPDAAIRYAHQGYDPELGWDTRFETPFGERPRPREHGGPPIATYGDSHTYCDEVADDETWQTYLGDEIGRDVLNFGTGGYGPDQALLKFRRVRERVPAPLVVLGFVAENVNRIVNVYRPFYSALTGQRVTKPRFEQRGGELVLRPNPVPSADELARLGERDFVRSLGERDYWYNRNEYPVFAFPYSRILWNRRIWSELAYGRDGVDDRNPRPWTNLWTEPEARGLMLAILDRFATEARETGARPLLLMVPQRRELEQFLRTGRPGIARQHWLTHCRTASLDCVSPLEDFATHVARGGAVDALYRGHVSPEGNRIIARRLAAELRRLDAL